MEKEAGVVRGLMEFRPGGGLWWPWWLAEGGKLSELSSSRFFAPAVPPHHTHHRPHRHMTDTRPHKKKRRRASLSRLSPLCAVR